MNSKAEGTTKNLDIEGKIVFEYRNQERGGGIRKKKGDIPEGKETKQKYIKTFQGMQYKYGEMLLKFEYTVEYTITEADEI